VLDELVAPEPLGLVLLQVARHVEVSAGVTDGQHFLGLEVGARLGARHVGRSL